MQNRVFALIPARMESARLPGKPLRKIAGVPMIVHVAKRAALSPRVTKAVVCTDSIEILMTCEKYGIEVCLTRSTHQNGTERIAEAAEVMGLTDDDIIVDVQGDEPFVRPEYIEEVADFTARTGYGCVVPHQMIDEYGNLNRVKMVSHDDRVIYFSRADVPCHFGEMPQPLKKHLSIIGFRLPALRRFVSSPPTPLENTERIELMRLVELGEPIGTFLQTGTSLSVDTPEDYELACRMMERDPLYRERIEREIA
ncbi:3-deoxy-manno-octulosonate cytidylyltransferase [Aquicoccus porphyridii]|uniref:3-deoxy-manno-octulosonate cytidylyltransferase n=1 Tax=Aquicoccus porphyridii TaxID=1852029 RepID=A0A5A9Z667_9RHOB|nr:3-deoxy-manno-octulosonate cytidylyltransferase [Aquicoccus porphyridii]KAA0912644.1 3-deoxy-manno-octulosonate cytidylyltransferase [Aquicoccus porphyridii]RAI55455.1 3-deoxy-manno-octulosonate cytidylyltransferase [Rhodobacteraceae bacterium AsT-22]